MDKKWEHITNDELEKLMTDTVRKINDDGHRRKFIEFLREYGIIEKSKIDEIASEFGLEYHKEDNSYWWI